MRKLERVERINEFFIKDKKNFKMQINKSYDPQITFIYPEDPPPETFIIDEHPEKFIRGIDNHILQSFLHLRYLGRQVNMAKIPPKKGIIFYHPDYPESIPPNSESLRVVFLADHARIKEKADLWIVQNPQQVNKRSFYLDHWPQPGMIPRDPSRGTLLENVVYIGRQENLNENLLTDAWKKEIRRLGVNWHIEEKVWWDYRKVDIAVAIRRPFQKKWWRKILPIKSFWENSKPASKLINSWLAGVPVILSNESAYHNLRERELDYLIAETPDQVISCIQELQKNATLYAQMVENGIQRRQFYFADKVAERLWALIKGPITAQYWKKVRRKRL